MDISPRRHHVAIRPPEVKKRTDEPSAAMIYPDRVISTARWVRTRSLIKEGNQPGTFRAPSPVFGALQRWIASMPSFKRGGRRRATDQCHRRWRERHLTTWMEQIVYLVKLKHHDIAIMVSRRKELLRRPACATRWVLLQMIEIRYDGTTPPMMAYDRAYRHGITYPCSLACLAIRYRSISWHWFHDKDFGTRQRARRRQTGRSNEHSRDAELLPGLTSMKRRAGTWAQCFGFEQAKRWLKNVAKHRASWPMCSATRGKDDSYQCERFMSLSPILNAVYCI